MKTDTILVGITMGLLLLTSPAASGYHTLEISGNANENDAINIQGKITINDEKG